jgi:CheY-like chemotaxis protein
VEDDELVRGMATAALESIGYTPLVADSAQEALQMCAQPGADIRLILTDVVMPGMTGAELRERVNAIRPDIKVLFMSGYTANVIMTHGVLKKGIHFIQKPFSVDELGRKIAEILGPAGG